MDRFLRNPSTDKSLYSYRNPWGGIDGQGIFTRNPNCWLNGVKNLSCISAAQMSGAAWNQRGGTLISPRHFILAKHFVFAILEGGTNIKFVADDSTVVTRKAISYALDPNSDIAIGLLDSDIPSSIKFAKVLPPNHNLYLSQKEIVRYAIFLDQEAKASIGVNTYLSYTPPPPGYQHVVYVQNPNYIYSQSLKAQIDPGIYSFYETPIAGDSGQPMFLLIDNELVIISTWTTPVSGPAICGRYNIINALMNDLGGGYQLTPVDLEYVKNKYLSI